ncbi:hypothetical protein O181_058841 [Austropuccinia psidii MF-1]|uniref:Uncharacterized protein n=1 Tax=Austropuccinia psidii MF-1 TaxID=1389203 RepID=A0A9Q3EHV8_9BASI|nr:hypothetical protein [Austropuccinia psidii MF-1]
MPGIPTGGTLNVQEVHCEIRRYSSTRGDGQGSSLFPSMLYQIFPKLPTLPVWAETTRTHWQGDGRTQLDTNRDSVPQAARHQNSAGRIAGGDNVGVGNGPSPDRLELSTSRCQVMAEARAFTWPITVERASQLRHGDLLTHARPRS